MPDLSDPASISSLVQTGGVVAFAYAVLMQLRELKPLLTALKDGNAQMIALLSALLERERARAERYASPSTSPVLQRPPPTFTPAQAPANYRGEPVVAVDPDETPPLGTAVMASIVDPSAPQATMIVPASSPAPKRTATPPQGAYMVVNPRRPTNGDGNGNGG